MVQVTNLDGRNVAYIATFRNCAPLAQVQSMDIYGEGCYQAMRLPPAMLIVILF
jgi:hypothetical protein